MPAKLRRRFWIEAITASATAILFLVTLVSRDWIEIVSGWDPDRHSGSAEWFVVAALFVIAAVLFAAARFEWRRGHTRLAAPASRSAH